MKALCSARSKHESNPEGTIEFLFALWSRAEKRERGDSIRRFRGVNG